MRTWADDAGITPSSKTLDRNAGDGPPVRCCARRFVAADALVRYNELAADKLALVCARFASFKLTDEIYLCDACRETLRRERVLARIDMPTSRPLRFPEVK